ncbi:unnamed protein product, partial [Discosporangium mesarthrocarpum]
TNRSVAPVISLDSKKYKLVQQLDAAVPGAVPSLIGCDRLTVKGSVAMPPGIIFKGTCSVTNSSSEMKTLPPREYDNATVDLTDAQG